MILLVRGLCTLCSNSLERNGVTLAGESLVAKMKSQERSKQQRQLCSLREGWWQYQSSFTPLSSSRGVAVRAWNPPSACAGAQQSRELKRNKLASSKEPSHTSAEMLACRRTKGSVPFPCCESSGGRVMAEAQSLFRTRGNHSFSGQPGATLTGGIPSFEAFQPESTSCVWHVQVYRTAQ